MHGGFFFGKDRPALRNRGTFGGLPANTDPAAHDPAGALGSGETITTDKRDIVTEDYLQGMFETALDEGQIIISVSFPRRL